MQGLSSIFARGTIALLPALTFLAVAARAEDLDPPGPPGSAATRMKSLNEVEPRTIITNLPFTVTNSGAYYLIRNLDGVVGTNGITINADNVRLDLNGFALVGKAGTLSGITIPTIRGNIAIRNGVVRNWSSHGVDGGLNARDCQYVDLLCSGNGQNGISAGYGAFVSRCVCYNNGLMGILAQEGSAVTDCKAADNAGHGIMCFSASRLQNCTAKDNHSDGIWVKNNCDVRNCTSTWNTNYGIEATSQCTVMDNHCGGNGGAGISVIGTGSRIENNNLVSNLNAVAIGGPQGRNLVVRNTSAGSTGTAFDLSTNNYYGAIITGGAMGFSGFTNNNAWANFEY